MFVQEHETGQGSTRVVLCANDHLERPASRANTPPRGVPARTSMQDRYGMMAFGSPEPFDYGRFIDRSTLFVTWRPDLAGKFQLPLASLTTISKVRTKVARMLKEERGSAEYRMLHVLVEDREGISENARKTYVNNGIMITRKTTAEEWKHTLQTMHWVFQEPVVMNMQITL